MTPEENFQRGVARFNAGEFFLAHEVWEEIWIREREPEKTFLQGLIQLAAAFHHYLRGNRGGAQSLLAASAVKLQRFLPDHRGIAIGKLRAETVSWARMLGEGESPGAEKLPKISAC